MTKLEILKLEDRNICRDTAHYQLLSHRARLTCGSLETISSAMASKWPKAEPVSSNHTSISSYSSSNRRNQLLTRPSSHRQPILSTAEDLPLATTMTTSPYLNCTIILLSSPSRRAVTVIFPRLKKSVLTPARLRSKLPSACQRLLRFKSQ